MKKYLHYCLLFGLVITPYLWATPIVSKQFSAQPFHAIDINGPINIQISSGQARYTMQLLGDQESLRHVYAAVKNGTLYLSLQPNYVLSKDSQLAAKVDLPFLDQLRYTGTGDVNAVNLSGVLNAIVNGNGTIVLLGKNLNLHNLSVAGESNVHILGIDSNLLNVQDTGSGKVNLGGTMVLQNVLYNGTGPLSIYWVNSSHVNVTGNGQGRIFLAGIANMLDATLSHRTYLDAKYLHARRAFINTHDISRADVWTKCSLSTLATDASNIYYYNDPALSTGSYMGPPGAVIRMTGIDNDHVPVPPKPC
jgi:hypothetical protein